MHETVIAENIINEAKKHGEVESINLEIGELAHVPGSELIRCLEKIVSWKINWNEKTSTVNCDCGFNGHPTVLERGHDHFIIKCPKCKLDMPKVVDGTDVKIISISVK